MSSAFPHPIAQLALSEDGQATAKSVWFWDPNHRHINTDPIKVAPLEEGRFYVLDGYHRVEQARRDGHDAVRVTAIEMTPAIENRILADGFVPKTVPAEAPWTMNERCEFDQGAAHAVYNVFELKGKPTVDIEDVWTDANARHGGAARRIMQAITDKADALGATVRLMAFGQDETTDDKKLEAFYQSLGFKETGRDDGAALMSRAPGARAEAALKAAAFVDAQPAPPKRKRAAAARI